MSRLRKTPVTSGIPYPYKRLSVPPAQLATEEHTLRSSHFRGGVLRNDMLYERMPHRKLHVNKVVGDRYTLA